MTIDLTDFHNVNYTLGLNSGDEVVINSIKTLNSGLYDFVIIDKHFEEIELCGGNIYKAYAYVFCPEVYASLMDYKNNGDVVFISDKYSGFISNAPTLLTYNSTKYTVIKVLIFTSEEVTSAKLDKGTMYGNSFKVVELNSYPYSYSSKNQIASISTKIKQTGYGYFNTPYMLSKEMSVTFNDIGIINNINTRDVCSGMETGFMVTANSDALITNSNLPVVLPFTNVTDVFTYSPVYKCIYLLIPKENTIKDVSGQFKFNFNGTLI
jgi:hypothetical protein